MALDDFGSAHPRCTLAFQFGFQFVVLPKTPRGFAAMSAAARPWKLTTWAVAHAV
jgi:hypothetical protein